MITVLERMFACLVSVYDKYLWVNTGVVICVWSMYMCVKCIVGLLDVFLSGRFMVIYNNIWVVCLVIVFVNVCVLVVSVCVWLLFICLYLMFVWKLSIRGNCIYKCDWALSVCDKSVCVLRSYVCVDSISQTYSMCVVHLLVCIVILCPRVCVNVLFGYLGVVYWKGLVNTFTPIRNHRDSPCVRLSRYICWTPNSYSYYLISPTRTTWGVTSCGKRQVFALPSLLGFFISPFLPKCCQ